MRKKKAAVKTYVLAVRSAMRMGDGKRHSLRASLSSVSSIAVAVASRRGIEKEISHD
jgi:hypothetical protein